MGSRFDNFAFVVNDYAYADPYESIKAGQTAPSVENAPNEGSLGLLASPRPGWHSAVAAASVLRLKSNPAGNDCLAFHSG
ncbi:MAG TPA: hypothetical protein VH207_12930 [Chthoniobacterales bacterium]|jgi:hypothetical protein|nr:hypothetical protein [Chthoniobacterales bacterium]